MDTFKNPFYEQDKVPLSKLEKATVPFVKILHLPTGQYVKRRLNKHERRRLSKKGIKGVKVTDAVVTPAFAGHVIDYFTDNLDDYSCYVVFKLSKFFLEERLKDAFKERALFELVKVTIDDVITVEEHAKIGR